jgi:hypothetical protein
MRPSVLRWAGSRRRHDKSPSRSRPARHRGYASPCENSRLALTIFDTSVSSERTTVLTPDSLPAHRPLIPGGTTACRSRHALKHAAGSRLPRNPSGRSLWHAEASGGPRQQCCPACRLPAATFPIFLFTDPRVATGLPRAEPARRPSNRPPAYPGRGHRERSH